MPPRWHIGEHAASLTKCSCSHGCSPQWCIDTFKVVAHSSSSHHITPMASTTSASQCTHRCSMAARSSLLANRSMQGPHRIQCKRRRLTKRFWTGKRRPCQKNTRKNGTCETRLSSPDALAKPRERRPSQCVTCSNHVIVRVCDACGSVLRPCRHAKGHATCLRCAWCRYHAWSAL